MAENVKSITKEFNRKWNRLKKERKNHNLVAVKKDEEYSKKQDLLVRKYNKKLKKVM